MKNKKILVITILVLVLLGGLGTFGFITYKNYMEEQRLKEEQEKKEKAEALLLETIKNNYNEKVITTKESKLYKLENDKYIEIGTINSDVNLYLEVIGEATLKNEYFKLAKSNYYIYHDAVKPDIEFSTSNNYKNYVPFDNDILTKSGAKVYLNDKELYVINEELQLPIIINDTNAYHVELNNMLVEIKKEDVSKTIENKRNQAVATNIGVLNYHFFYDAQKENCNEIICLEKSKFEQHLKYLQDNDFYTATMKDMALWMNKKIRLPKKTTVITVDDGALGTDTHLIELLEKYDMHGTLFLITAWWPKEKYVSPNLEIQSHGYDIHTNGGAVTRSRDVLLADVKKSISKLDGENTAFCYPFYAHNYTTKEVLKQAGFKIAFVGGNVKANQNHDPYQIYRYVIYSYTSVNDLKYMVN